MRPETFYGRVERALHVFERSPHVSESDQLALDHDVRWGASRLLAAFLHSSFPTVPMITEEVASALLTTWRAASSRGRGSTTAAPAAADCWDVSTLKAKGWLRFVFGVTQLPYAIAMRVHGSEADLTVELQFLKCLYETQHGLAGRPKRQFWVPCRTISELRASHASVFRQTPSIQQLMGTGVLRRGRSRGEQGYVLGVDDRTDTSLWWHLAGRIAAGTWYHLCNDQRLVDDQTRFRYWLAFADSWRDVSDASTVLSGDLNERLLDAALEAVLAEKDLDGWEEEAEKLRWEQHGDPEAYYRRGAVEPPKDRTDPWQRLLWWRSLEESEHVFPYGDSREAINMVVSLIIRGNDGPGPNGQRHTRLNRLIAAGEHKPYLAALVPRLLKGVRPTLLPALLLTMDTAAIALSAIADLQLDHDAWGLDPRVLGTESEDWKSRACSCAAEMVAAVAAGELDPESRRRRTAATFASVLLDLARKRAQMFRRRTVPAESKESWGLTRCIEAVFAALAQTRLGVRVVGDGRECYPVVLAALAGDLCSALTDATKDVGRPQFEDIHQPVLALLFELYRRLTSLNPWDLAAVRHSGQTVTTPGDVANAILGVYTAGLSRETYVSERDGSLPVSWSGEPPGVWELPWVRVAIECAAMKQLESFLRPVQFEHSISAISDELERRKASGTGNGDQWNDPLRIRAQAWAHKVRLHLRLLTEVHSHLVLDRGGDAPDRIQAVGDAVEAEVVRLLEAIGRESTKLKEADIFQADYERPSFADRDCRLFNGLLVSLNKFSPPMRLAAFDALVRHSDDPARLAEMAVGAAGLLERKQALDRLKGLDIGKYLESVHWFPEMEHALVATANAAETEAAERILEHALAAATGRPLQGRWEVLAYRVRLLLAFHRKQRETLERLSPPEVDKRDRELRDLQASPGELAARKGALLALLDLESNPRRAYEFFCGHLANKRDDAGATVNRFAAHIRMAEDLQSESEKTDELRRALEEWELAEQGLPQDARREVAQYADYNRLRCYVSLGLTDRTDELWAALPDQMRYKPEFLQLMVNECERSKRLGLLQGLLSGAVRYHAVQSVEELRISVGSVAAGMQLTQLGMAAPAGVAVGTTQPVDKTSIRASLCTLLQLAPRDLVDVAWNCSLDHYIVELVQASAEDMLERWVTLRALKSENKYTDFVLSQLKAAIGTLTWQVGGPDRGAISAGGKDAGLRDIVVKNSRGSSITIIEALRVRGKTGLNSKDKKEIAKHIKKLFAYDSIGLDFLVLLVYCECPEFLSAWNGFCHEAISLTLDGLTLLAGGDVDVGGEFPPLRSNIRIGRVKYVRQGREVSLYHVFVNMIPGP